MAVERYVEQATATAAGSPGLSGAARPGSGPLDSRAPLRWPYRSREQQERAERAAAEAEKSETMPESSEAGDSDEKNSRAGWDNNEEVE